MKYLGTVCAVLSTTAIAFLSDDVCAFTTPRSSFSSTSTSTSGNTKDPAVTALSMGFLDDISDLINAKSNAGSTKKKPTVTVPPGFQIPDPKPLTITRPSFLPSALKSSAALAVRLATSAFVLGWQIDTLTLPPSDLRYALTLGPLRLRDSSPVLATAPRPAEPLILYEYDSSPFCKRVRETINLLDLTVEYRPIPGARQSRFSEELFERTGRRTVPYLVDPNTGEEMFESDEQIRYLVDTYGPQGEGAYDPKALWPITFTGFSVFTSTLAALIRGMPSSQRQYNAREDNEDMEPLELWGYECSPFVKPVREKLGSLCLPHRLVSCSRGSANRDRMIERTGRFQVPFLVDPNTGLELFESVEICEYLDACYTTKTAPALTED